MRNKIFRKNHFFTLYLSVMHRLILNLPYSQAKYCTRCRLCPPVTNNMTSILYGTRFLWIEPLPEKIQRDYKIQRFIAPFSGSLEVLSNFYQSELEIYGVKHKSTEHAFPYTKAIRLGDVDVASRITAAEDALLDTQLGKTNQN